MGVCYSSFADRRNRKWWEKVIQKKLDQDISKFSISSRKYFHENALDAREMLNEQERDTKNVRKVLDDKELDYSIDEYNDGESKMGYGHEAVWERRGKRMIRYYWKRFEITLE